LAGVAEGCNNEATARAATATSAAATVQEAEDTGTASSLC